MSLGFKSGIQNNFTNAITVIDKFHIIKHANKSVDDVRKKESKENILLKCTKYIWLKNNNNLNEKEVSIKQSLTKKHIKTGRACMIREELQTIYGQSINITEAKEKLRKLCNWMMRSRLEPMKKLCKMIRNHYKTFFWIGSHGISTSGATCIQRFARAARTQQDKTRMRRTAETVVLQVVTALLVTLSKDGTKKGPPPKRRPLINLYSVER